MSNALPKGRTRISTEVRKGSKVEIPNKAWSNLTTVSATLPRPSQISGITIKQCHSQALKVSFGELDPPLGRCADGVSSPNEPVSARISSTRISRSNVIQPLNWQRRFLRPSRSLPLPAQKPHRSYVNQTPASAAPDDTPSAVPTSSNQNPAPPKPVSANPQW